MTLYTLIGLVPPGLGENVVITENASAESAAAFLDVSEVEMLQGLKEHGVFQRENTCVVKTSNWRKTNSGRRG